MLPHSWLIRLLLRLYPRAYRERHAPELSTAMQACVQRERAAGLNPLLTSVRLIVDAASAAILVRRDIRRQQGSPPSLKLRRASATQTPGDSFMQSLIYDIRYALRL